MLGLDRMHGFDHLDYPMDVVEEALDVDLVLDVDVHHYHDRVDHDEGRLGVRIRMDGTMGTCFLDGLMFVGHKDSLDSGNLEYYNHKDSHTDYMELDNLYLFFAGDNVPILHQKRSIQVL